MVDLRSGLRTKSRSWYAPLVRHKIAAILLPLALVLGSIGALAAVAPPTKLSALRPVVAAPGKVTPAPAHSPHKAAAPDTNFLTRDRDGDGEPDFAEIRLGTFLKNSWDSDNDGIPDAQEDKNHNGVVDLGETDPANPDTDGDGLVDGFEMNAPGDATHNVMSGAQAQVYWSTVRPDLYKNVTFAPPTIADLDSDGLINALDPDDDNDGVLTKDEISGSGYPRYPGITTNPYMADTDQDGLTDRQELTYGTNPQAYSSDADTLSDGHEVRRWDPVAAKWIGWGTNPLDPDTDHDGIKDGEGVDGMVDAAGNPVDTDGDGMINALDADSDNDGLNDGQEKILATDPANFDTDGDGWPDGYEYHLAARGFDPKVADIDNDRDGLPNGVETAWWKTLTNYNDSDGDGIPDMKEGPDSTGWYMVDQAGNRLPAGSTVGIKMPLDSDNDALVNALDSDSDNDGIPDEMERQGVVDVHGQRVHTDPYKADTDGDGLSDGAELFVFHTDPLVADTDGDGISDGDEIKVYHTDPLNADTDGDGIKDGDELAGKTVTVHLSNGTNLTYTIPNNDVDGDGIINPLDPDDDNDGLLTKDELGGKLFAHHLGVQTNPYSSDTDGDGLEDGFEMRMPTPVGWLAVPPGQDPATRDWFTDPTNSDTDGDGLNDHMELLELTWSTVQGHTIHIATDPNNPDTDADGISDGREVLNWHSNPINVDTDGDGIMDGQTLTIRWINAAGQLDSTYFHEDSTSNKQIPDGTSNVTSANSDWNLHASDDHNFRDRTSYAYRLLKKPDGITPVLGPLNPGSPDTDGDGVGDMEEVLAGSDPLDARSHANITFPWDSYDPDHDGLYNAEELILGTDPYTADTDGDGLLDGVELDPLGVDLQHNGTPGGAGGVPDIGPGDVAGRLWPTDPLKADTDGDGLNDRTELLAFMDPLITDTDGDAIGDNIEFTSSIESAINADTDGDKLVDSMEDLNKNGVQDLGETLPNNADTDGDNTVILPSDPAYRVWRSMDDANERLRWQTDALSATADLDSDGLLDQAEVFTYHTDPRFADTDLDGLTDGFEVTTPADPVTSIAYDPINRDSDGDYLIDGYEYNKTWTAPLGSYAVLPASFSALNFDSDSDGMWDCAEVAMQLASATKPDVQDTDGDGIMDGVEAPTPTAPGTDKEALAYQTKGSYLSNPSDLRVHMNPAVYDPSQMYPMGLDSDGDGYIDSGLLVGDDNPAPFSAPYKGHESISVDTDGDGASNAMDVDSDNDWIRDGDQNENYTADLDGDGILNILDGDSYDNDNLLDPLEFTLFEADKAMGDSDYDDDGLMDGNEYYQWFFNPIPVVDALSGTPGLLAEAVRVHGDPRLYDTDADGLPDGLEAGLSRPQVPVPPPTVGVGGTLNHPPFDADSTSDSEVGNWDTDNDGLADGVEVGALLPDAVNGVDANFLTLATATRTNPRDADTDDDGLMDGSENIKITLPETIVYTPTGNDTLRVRNTTPYDAAYDRSNPLNCDTDQDGLMDGLESGLQAYEYPEPAAPTRVHGTAATSVCLDAPAPLDVVDHGMFQTNPKLADTDADGLLDGQEDANHNGAWEFPVGKSPFDSTGTAVQLGVAETDPNNSDTDRDQVLDGTDSQPLSHLRGGADWDLDRSGDHFGWVITAPDPASTQKFLATAAGVVTIYNTFPPNPNPDAADGPSGKAIVTKFYGIASDFYKTDDHPDFPEQYAACAPIPSSDVQVTFGVDPVTGCGDLASGAGVPVNLNVSVAAATLPGVYSGKVYFLASLDNSQTPPVQVGACGQTTSLAVSTVVPYDSMDVSIVVPPYYDFDILNVDNTYAPVWGVGASNPYEFYAGDAVNNEMHLKGLVGRDGLLTGVFQLSNGNGVPDVNNDGNNDINCQPAFPKPKWDPDMPGNTLLSRISYRFDQTAGPTVPSGAVTFVPASGVQPLGLGVRDSVIFQLNTKGIGACGPNGIIEGTVTAWYDVNGNGVQDSYIELENTVVDQFRVKIELVTPDLDIPDNQGSLVGNQLAAQVDPSKALPEWTFKAIDIQNTLLNNLNDAFDGPGCEAFDTPSLWDVQTTVETPLAVSVLAGTVPANTAKFTVYKYNPTDQTYDTRYHFDVKVWSYQNGMVGRDTTQEEHVKIDSTTFTTNLPEGHYRPFYGNGNLENSYVFFTVRGRASGHTRTATGYPAVYQYTGEDPSKPEFGLFDRFQVDLDVQQRAALICDTGDLTGDLTSGQSVTLHGTVYNCGQSFLTGVTAQLQGNALSGCDYTLDGTASLSKTSLAPGDSATLTVSATDSHAAKACSYLGLVIVTGTNALGTNGVDSIQVVVDLKPLAATTPIATPVQLVCDAANPAAGVADVPIVNTGNTDLNLVATASSGLPVTPSSPVVVLYRHTGNLHVAANCGGLLAGSYSGNVSLTDASYSYTTLVPVQLTVVAAPNATFVPIVTSVTPGAVAAVKIAVTNTGNIPIPAGQTTVTLDGDFASALPGGKAIPGKQTGNLPRELAVGATDTLVVNVPVEAGYFCGSYSAPMTLTVTAGGRTKTVPGTATITLSGCQDRPIAFSDNPVRYSRTHTVEIATTATTPVTIKVYNMEGLLVRTLVDGQVLSNGFITWDMKNDDGDLLASGVYIVSAQVNGTVHREKLLFVK